MVTAKDFEIGTEFEVVHFKANKFRVTDVGSRVIAAIQITQEKPAHYFDGPPYAPCEVVFDEDDMQAIKILKQMNRADD